jgi:RNA polymerase sigma-70 factor (ECF subfamily)
MSYNKTICPFSAHHNKIVSYANNIVKDVSRAEDVVQEAYVRFYKAMEQGNEWSNPLAYLYRIVHNLAVDHHRRAQLEHKIFSHEEDIAELCIDQKSSIERQAFAQNELECILEALNTLPERTRIAFEMHRFGGYSMQAIGDHLGLSKSMATQLVAQGLVVCRRATSQT